MRYLTILKRINAKIYNQYNFYFNYCQYDFCWPVKVIFRNFSKLKMINVKLHLLLYMGYLVKIRSLYFNNLNTLNTCILISYFETSFFMCLRFPCQFFLNGILHDHIIHFKSFFYKHLKKNKTQNSPCIMGLTVTRFIPGSKNGVLMYLAI